jgi:hypothetical protein
VGLGEPTEFCDGLQKREMILLFEGGYVECGKQKCLHILVRFSEDK